MPDLSTNRDFAPLAKIVAELQSVAAPQGIDFMLIGATARDLMLRAFDLDSPRRTEDVDFGFVVATWDIFHALRATLLASGRFLPHERPSIHKLRHADTGYQLDIVPFGAIENEERKIMLPPGSGMEFNCFGMQEAFAVRVAVILPGPVIAQVASIPALTLLKIIAFNDRKTRFPGKDAPDLLLLARYHLTCGNMDRFFEKHQDLMGDDFDSDTGSARLLARDVAGMVSAADLDRLIGILVPEIDPDGPLILVAQTNAADLGRAREIFAALAQELAVQRGKV